MADTGTTDSVLKIEDQLARVSVGTIELMLERIGYYNCFMVGVRPVTPAMHFVGRARTLRCLPVRPDVLEARRKDALPNPHRVAIDGVSPGEVLVIDVRGSKESAVVGDLLATRVKVAGGVAIVTDGCIRDSGEIAKLGLPVHSAGTNDTTFSSRFMGMDVNVPIACGGVLVLPGDYLVGDADGVVVVPSSVVGKVAELSLEQEALDAFIREKIEAGVPIARAYPPDQELMEEYRRRKGQNNS